MSDNPHRLPWRTGRTVGRTIYDCDERLIGTMDSRDLAAHVVEAVNAKLATDTEGADPCHER